MTTLEQLVAQALDIERRLKELEVRLDTNVTESEANVGDPPTNANLDTAFGTPAQVGSGFVGFVDDAGAETNVWLCLASDNEWWYVAMTKAL